MIPFGCGLYSNRITMFVVGYHVGPTVIHAIPNHCICLCVGDGDSEIQRPLAPPLFNILHSHDGVMLMRRSVWWIKRSSCCTKASRHPQSNSYHLISTAYQADQARSIVFRLGVNYSSYANSTNHLQHCRVMSGSGGFYKYRCRYFLTHNCPNWVWVHNAPCANCLAEGRDDEFQPCQDFNYDLNTQRPCQCVDAFKLPDKHFDVSAGNTEPSWVGDWFQSERFDHSDFLEKRHSYTYQPWPFQTSR
jgi:hypothetical protein